MVNCAIGLNGKLKLWRWNLSDIILKKTKSEYIFEDSDGILHIAKVETVADEVSHFLIPSKISTFDIDPSIMRKVRAKNNNTRYKFPKSSTIKIKMRGILKRCWACKQTDCCAVITDHNSDLIVTHCVHKDKYNYLFKNEDEIEGVATIYLIDNKEYKEE